LSVVSATITSVVISSAATEAAPCKARAASRVSADMDQQPLASGSRWDLVASYHIATTNEQTIANKGKGRQSKR